MVDKVLRAFPGATVERIDADEERNTTELPIQYATRCAQAGMTVFPVDMRPGVNQKAPLPGYMWKERASSVLREVVDDFIRAEQTIGTENVGVGWALGRDNYIATDLDHAEPEWWASCLRLR